MKKYEFLYNGSKDKLLGCFPDKNTYIGAIDKSVNKKTASEL